MGQAIKNGITGDFEPTDINSPAFGATHYGEQSEDGIAERAEKIIKLAESYGITE